MRYRTIARRSRDLRGGAPQDTQSLLRHVRKHGRTSPFRAQPDCRLLRSGAVAAVLLGLAITGLNLIHLNAYMLLLGPALVLAGILAVRTQGHGTDPADVIGPPLSRPTSLLVQALFWLLLAWAALMAHSAATERPLAFFIVVAVAWALLALRTMEKPEPATIASILFGAILLSLVVRGSVFFLTPGFPGSDAWAHDQLTQAILTDGHIPAEWESPYYLHYPALHLTVASTSLLTGLSPKASLFVGIGVPLTVSALGVFVISRRFGTPQTALLAALIVLFASYHLQWGTQIIPTSLGLSFFTLSIVLCLRPDSVRPAGIALLLMTAIALVLSHTVSSFILWTSLLVLLAISLIIRLLTRKQLPPPLGPGICLMILFLTVAMFIHWSTNPYAPTGESFLERMLVTARDSILGDAGFLERPWDVTVSTGLAQELVAISSFAMFYFLATQGTLKLLRSHPSAIPLIATAGTVAILSLFVFSFPLFGIRTILPHRWFAFIWVLAAPLAASGLIRLLEIPRYYAFSALCVAGATGILAFAMVTAPVSNTDSPIYASRMTQRLCFYESELSAAEWLSTKSDGPFASDLQFGTRILRDGWGLQLINTNLLEQGISDKYYLCRHTSVLRPVQKHGGTSMVLGAKHALEMESQRPAVYRNLSSSIFAPASKVDQQERTDGA